MRENAIPIGQGIHNSTYCMHTYIIVYDYCYPYLSIYHRNNIYYALLKTDNVVMIRAYFNGRIIIDDAFIYFSTCFEREK